MICRASAGPRATWAVNGRVAPAAGTYDVGIVIKNTSAALNDNDYINLTWMVVN